jgi:hypothetical protein
MVDKENCVIRTFRKNEKTFVVRTLFARSQIPNDLLVFIVKIQNQNVLIVI